MLFHHFLTIAKLGRFSAVSKLFHLFRPKSLRQINDIATDRPNAFRICRISPRNDEKTALFAKKKMGKGEKDAEKCQ
jgi:hypothetical protein